ncbi:uncharacterized protein LOC124172730 isoform X2 [Ischnura elegans]|uniref:uncharacterized protein LOC124172730 isoform X2 n=1 Tax=Ischnura elegans TaxID=197161 RepID=UPI001ED89968|nr:uncharacterized protein LOC124172730 isoform X2 [Ischnura elegans]
MMSGKPEQQPIQNVVVYVSAGDNFAHSYSVGQQNVAFQHPQNGAFPPATPLTCKKPALKAEFVNGSPNPGGLYTPPSVQPNGYATGPTAGLAYGGAAGNPALLKSVGAGQHMCGHPEPQASVEEQQQQICSYASPALATHSARICAGPAFIDKGPRDADVLQGNYVAAVAVERGAGDTAPRGFLALCGEGSPTTGGGPRASSRCDSARSEAAESSCSSLSSEGPQEAVVHPMVCRGGPVALAAGQILLQGGQGLAQLAPPGGLHFSPQGQEAVQSYIACPGGGVVLGNQTVVLNGQQALGGTGHHATGNLVLTMTVPQLVQTGALGSNAPVLQAFTTVGSLASTAPAPAPPPTVTLAHGGVNSQTLLHPTIPTPPVAASAPVVVNSAATESASTTTATTSQQPGVSIPLGWKRLLSASGSVVYVSPSSTQLSSLDHVKEYLQTPGTCKCGLECPLKFETVFNFDPKVPGKAWSDDNSQLPLPDMGKLCSHKRKAAEASSQQQQPRPPSAAASKRELSSVPTTAKKKKRKAGSPYEGAPPPQMFSTKDQQGGVLGPNALIQTFPRPLLQPHHRLSSVGTATVAGGPMVTESHSAVMNSQFQFQQNQRPMTQLWSTNERDSPAPVRTPVLPVIPTSNFGPALVPVSSSNMQSSTSSPSSTTPAVNLHLTGSVGYGAGGILVHSGSNGFTPGGSMSSGYGLQGMSVVGGRIMFGEDIPKGQALNPETVLKVQQHFPPGTRLVPDEGCKVPRNLQHHFVPNGIVAAPSLEAFRTQMPQGQLVVDGMGVRTFPTQPNVSIPATIPHTSTVQAQSFERASAPHHQQWEDLCKRKKGNSPNFINSNITSKIKRTKYSALERESSPCPNVDVRQIPMEHRLPPPNVSGSYTIITARNSTPSPSTTTVAHPHSTGITSVMGVPSFMEDPTAYLAQQTALLNSTISRQTGGNIMFGGDVVSPSNSRQSSTPHTNPQVMEANHSGLISSSSIGIIPHPTGLISTKTGNLSGQTVSVSASCALPKSCSNTHVNSVLSTLASTAVDCHTIQSFIATSPSLGGCHQTMTTVSTTMSMPATVCHSQVTGTAVKNQNIIYQPQNSKPVLQAQHQQIILRQPGNEFVLDQLSAPKEQSIPQTCNVSNITSGSINVRPSISNHSNSHQLAENQFLQVSSPNQIHRHIVQSNFSAISGLGRHQPVVQQHQSPDDNPVTSSTFVEKTTCQQKDVNIDSQQLQVSRSQSATQSNHPTPFKSQKMPMEEQGAPQSYSHLLSTPYSQPSQNQLQLSDSRGPIQGGTVSTSQTCAATQGGGKTEDCVGSSERASLVMEGYSAAQVGGHSVLQEEASAPSSTQIACQALDGSIYITSTSSGGSSNGSDQKNISVNNVGQYSHASVVTTMASGHTVSSNTITSVQAGKASTVTVSGGSTSTSAPPASSPASHYSFSNIPTTQAFVSVSSSSNSKSPLEMVQSVVSSIQVPCNQPQGLELGASLVHPQQLGMGQPAILKASPSGLPPGHFLVSNGNGQFIVASATGGGASNAAPHNGGPGQIVKFHPPSSSATSIPLVATQPVMQLVNALPVGGGPPQLHLLQHHPQQQHQHCHSDIHQMTVGLPVDGAAARTVHTELVGATIQQPHLQPQVISPGISKRKGKKRKPSPQTVASMLHIATQHQQQGQLPTSHHHAQQQVVVPGSATGYGAPGGMLQAVAFVPGGGKFLMNQFAGASTGGAAGNNGNPGAAAYGTIGQQVGQIGGSPHHLLATASSSQALHATGVNLLQPLSLGGTPGTATLLQNFPFQQLIGTGATVVAAVPGLQGMVMSALPDGTLVPTGATTSNPDASNQGLPPLQLHLQNLNGQNVLTQVQPAHAQNIFGQVNPHQQHALQAHPSQAQPSPHHQLVATGGGGMVIRGHAPTALPNSQHHHMESKVMQQPHAVLSQGQFLVNGNSTGNPGTLIPHGSAIQGNHQITVNQSGSADQFVNSGGAVLRPNREFLQCSGNVLVPISQPQQQHSRQTIQTAPSPLPPGSTIPSANQTRAQIHGSQQNTTVVQQNTTTIVQQQTMMVSNNHSSHHQQTHPCHPQSAPQQQPAIVANYGAPSEIDSSLLSQQNVILEGSGGMTVPLLQHYTGIRPTLSSNAPIAISPNHPSAAILLRHSVSTQTAVNQSVQATSPPVYVTTVQSSNQGLLSASTCYVPSAAPPTSRPAHAFTESILPASSVQSSSELSRGNSIMASAGSPPDTTTHSATASPADTTTNDVASNLQASISSTSTAASTCMVSGSTEGFAPSRTPIPHHSSCGISPSRNLSAEAQCSVHFVSSSEPEPSPSAVTSGGGLASSSEREEGGDIDKGPIAIHSASRSGPEHSVSNSMPHGDSVVSGSALVTSGFLPLGARGEEAKGRDAGAVIRVSEKDAQGMVMGGGSAMYVGRGEKTPPVESTVVVALGFPGIHSAGALQGEGKGGLRDVGNRDVLFVSSGADRVDAGKLCTSSADVQLVEDRKSFRRKHSDVLVVEGLADADEEEVVK